MVRFIPYITQIVIELYSGWNCGSLAEASLGSTGSLWIPVLRALASCLIVLCDGFASLLFEALVAELQRIPPDLEVNYSRYSLSAALRLLGAFFSVSRKILPSASRGTVGFPT